jgi:hypothetical protein
MAEVAGSSPASSTMHFPRENQALSRARLMWAEGRFVARVPVRVPVTRNINGHAGLTNRVLRGGL